MKQKSILLMIPLLALSILPIAVGMTIVSALLCAGILAYYHVCFGARAMLVGAVCIFGIAWLLGGVETAVILVALSVPMGAAVGSGFSHHVSLGSLLVRATLLQTAALAGNAIYAAKAANTTPADMLLTAPMDEYFRVLTDSEQVDEALLSQLREMMNAGTAVVRTLLPCLFILLAALSVYCVFGAVRGALGKRNIHFENMPYFYELHLSKSMCVLFSLLFIAQLFAGDKAPVLTNAVAVTSVLLFVCGLSVVDYYLKGKGLHGALRALIYVAATMLSSLLGGLILSLLCIVGLLDGMRGLRR